jgi:hypothetical protein
MEKRKSPNLTWEEENSLTFSYNENAIEDLRKFVESNDSQDSK